MKVFYMMKRAKDQVKISLEIPHITVIRVPMKETMIGALLPMGKTCILCSSDHLIQSLLQVTFQHNEMKYNCCVVSVVFHLNPSLMHRQGWPGSRHRTTDNLNPYGTRVPSNNSANKGELQRRREVKSYFVESCWCHCLKKKLYGRRPTGQIIIFYSDRILLLL